MISRRVLVVIAGSALLAAAAGVAACTSTVRPPFDDSDPSEPSPGPVSGGDAGEDAGSPATTTVSCTGDDAGSCNNINLCGNQVTLIQVPQAAPDPAGGAITPGIYSMTAYPVYTGTSGGAGKLPYWFQETFRVSAPSSGAEDAGSDDAGAGAGGTIAYPWDDALQSSQASEVTGSGFLVTSGTTLTYQYECVTPSSVGATYTATATTIQVFLTSSLGKGVLTYTLVQ